MEGSSNLSSKNDRKQSESPKRKIFQMSQKYFTVLGISPILMVQSNPFNQKNLICFLVFGLQLISEFIYILYEAETFWDYIQSIYFCSVSILATVVFLILVFRVDKLFKYIGNSENLNNIGKYSPKRRNTYEFLKKNLFYFSISSLSNIKSTHR